MRKETEMNSFKKERKTKKRDDDPLFMRTTSKVLLEDIVLVVFSPLF
jgi:hypothetical protein